MVSNEALNLGKKFGYLPETIERYIHLFGIEETKAILQAYNQEIKKTIRVNTLKITPEELKNRLEEKDFLLEKIAFCDYAFSVKEGTYSLGATTEYLTGYYFIQSKASLLPSIILQPSYEELIMDFAAAPGGKTTHIAQLMKNKGTLIALDISRERIRSLRSNLARCGIMNTIIIRMDSRKLLSYGLKADKILLDAPCSGEGLMAVDKTRRMNRTIKDIVRMNQLQKELLTAAIKSLNSDGIIAYSTCSTAPEENEEVISWALNEFPIKLVNPGFNEFQKGFTSAFDREYDPELVKARRLYPHLNGTEGFFFCKIKLEEEIK
ncbi:MAG: RsmB/NOP family class I SAM-dependent RNA methyltransferase [Asgard group archaeon]|nr:RsmB/NOP family class I SAM-dependent RNA methyltransferase [Asgard group archaeon]